MQANISQPVTIGGFPTVIDSTLMSHWRSCRRKTELESFQHWKPKEQSVHLHAGAAFAKGLEVTRQSFYAQGMSQDLAVGNGLAALAKAYGTYLPPADSAKSLERMLGALEYYFSAYPLGTDSVKPARLGDQRLGIEFSFLEPLDILHPVSGEPLLYSGRFDMIADYCGGLYGEDDKTTSSLGASWPKQWDLRSQFTAYTWGARRAGIELTGFIVRGVSILKTKYETLQAITPRPQWMVDLWYRGLLVDLQDMIAAWQQQNFRPNLDEACNAYGGCSFRKVCLSEPARQSAWLQMDFVRRHWNPVTRVETLLEA